MKKAAIALATIIVLSHSVPASAQVEPGYNPGKPPGGTIWYSPDGPAEKAADIGFVKGMHPHHAGALTMSGEYLNDPESVNGPLKQLARGIIRNQQFELDMLETIRVYHEIPADQAPRAFDMRPVAIKGLSQQKKFYRSPMPGLLDVWAGPSDVSVRDVQFAKAMIIHHQGALDMANDYLANPAARNGYLRLMCMDILLDQSQEIAFMQSIIDAFPGDPDSVKIDPSMVHGMEGMSHGSGHGGHH